MAADKSPDAYRTISEAAEEADLPAHVLRFWESKFSQLKPLKRNGGRRLYRRQDIQLVKGLRRLLYEEGYTIKGAQKYLREHGVASVADLGAGGQARPAEPAVHASRTEAAEPREAEGPAELESSERSRLEKVLERLERARARLDEALSA